MEARKQRFRSRLATDLSRDKLYEKEPTEISNAELLAMLVGPGNARSNGLQLAQTVLAACGNRLAELSKRSVRDLMHIAGIGRAKASALVAFAELSRRRQSEEAIVKPKIIDSMDAARYLTPLLIDLQQEVFGVLFLSRGGQIIDFEIMFKGGLTSTIVDVRRVFKKALLHQALSIIVCHNRIAGDAQPRPSDQALTERLRASAAYLDIKLMDHIIIGQKGYYSFAGEGKLN